MSAKKSARSDDPVVRPLHHFDDAWRASAPAARLRELRRAALTLREELLDEPEVRYYRSLPLVRVPYPAKYAFLNAYHNGVLDMLRTPSPFVHILNRMFVVQFETDDGPKTLLFSPSDIHANAETPFFKRLAEGMGPLREAGQKFLAPEIGTVEHYLAQLGLAPDDVDYISYDHLHTQDIRKWLGSGSHPGYFPKAKLLVMREEWESVHGLLPPQLEWYCPSGCDGVDPSRIVLLDGSVKLGRGVALVHTPGHTEGNHSLVAHTPEGLMVTSENGVGPDAYSPLSSEIPGLADFARTTGYEVVMNGNTLERGLEQYMSMVVEKTLAGPSVRNPAFCNVVCSSELAPYWGFPGFEPTFSFGDLHFGSLVG